MKYQSKLLQDAYNEGLKDGRKSLRDEFAGRAMQAIVGREDDIANQIASLKALAEISYNYADAMMEVRNEPK